MIEAARQRSPGDPEQVAEVDGQSGPLPRIEPLPATDAAAPRKQAVGGAPLAR